ncbi:hypothetical protein N7540_010128 [Penicillium herquei]|nr:hypothetical protein N7540_010128 [Penicillium herquei]
MSAPRSTVQDQLAQLTAEVILESFAIQDREREARVHTNTGAVRNFSRLYTARQMIPRTHRYYNISDADVSYLDLNDGTPEPVESKAAIEVKNTSNISEGAIKASPTLIEKMKNIFITTPKKLFRQVVAPGSRYSSAAVSTPLRRARDPARSPMSASAAHSPGALRLPSFEKPPGR